MAIFRCFTPILMEVAVDWRTDKHGSTVLLWFTPTKSYKLINAILFSCFICCQSLCTMHVDVALSIHFLSVWRNSTRYTYAILDLNLRVVRFAVNWSPHGLAYWSFSIWCSRFFTAIIIILSAGGTFIGLRIGIWISFIHIWPIRTIITWLCIQIWPNAAHACALIKR